MGIRHVLKNAADDPQQTPIIANKAIRLLRNKINSDTASNGHDFMAADWDTLVILDACRYDVFEEYAYDLQGVLEKAISKGSATPEFLRTNLSGRDMIDTVYVTANPQYYRLSRGILDTETVDAGFHAEINVWQDGKWDDSYHTVRPETVTDAALEAIDTYPNKRHIIHYLQPHTPYIGPTGVEQLSAQQLLDFQGLNFWDKYKRGEFDFSIETMRKAYRENLELVLSEVEVLLNEIDGKTVVTADHGESLGDRDWPIPIRHYGHASSSRRKELIQVPWLVSTQGNRREIIAEQNDDERFEVETDTVEDRLQALGYAESGDQN